MLKMHVSAEKCVLGQIMRFQATKSEIIFSPRDIYLGELMSTVCSVHVGGWAGVGACSAEGVGGPAGSAGGRLGVDDRSFHPCRSF